MASARRGVQRVGYFGSYARGDWGVGSDLDVVLVVDAADQPFDRRPADWDLTGLPVPADLVVFTDKEWRAPHEPSRFHETLGREVVWVLGGPIALASRARARASRDSEQAQGRAGD